MSARSQSDRTVSHCELLEATEYVAIHCCPEPRLLLKVCSLLYKKTGLAAAVTESLSCFSDAGCGFKLQLEKKKRIQIKRVSNVGHIK